LILRRITEHVKAQNWTAIALDFVIVVVGVFIGIQVSNWNDAQTDKAQEDAYLNELRAEVLANNAITKENLGLTEITIAAGERSAAYLESSEPCSVGCWRLLVDFFHASQVAARPVSLAVFEEMRRQGLPRSNTVMTAMTIYATSNNAQASISQNLPEYRQHVRGLIPISIQRDLWRDCHSNSGNSEVYIVDCPATITEQEASAILEIIRADPTMLKELTFWIGQSLLNIGSLNNHIELGEQLIAAIDKELAQ